MVDINDCRCWIAIGRTHGQRLHVDFLFVFFSHWPNTANIYCMRYRPSYRLLQCLNNHNFTYAHTRTRNQKCFGILDVMKIFSIASSWIFVYSPECRTTDGVVYVLCAYVLLRCMLQTVAHSSFIHVWETDSEIMFSSLAFILFSLGFWILNQKQQTHFRTNSNST